MTLLVLSERCLQARKLVGCLQRSAIEEINTKLQRSGKSNDGAAQGCGEARLALRPPACYLLQDTRGPIRHTSAHRGVSSLSRGLL